MGQYDDRIMMTLSISWLDDEATLEEVLPKFQIAPESSGCGWSTGITTNDALWHEIDFVDAMKVILDALELGIHLDISLRTCVPDKELQ